jgi:predicted nuclease of restriction endonuclease-like (RecB) superfamily
MDNEIMKNMVDAGLYESIKDILKLAREKAYAAVNFAMVEVYWNIGRLIVEKQSGEERAEYGSSLINELSKHLTADFGKGFTATNLKYMRQFYLLFQNRHALRDQLTWTHYRMIMKVENPNAREYYLQESVKGIWSTRQLERQINSFCYERVLSSKNRDAVRDEIIKKEPGIMPFDVVKDPYVLEFLGLKQNDDLHETQLESALVFHIQKFLLELGRGFTFEARQKRISFDGEHFYIDLVFYNYILKCFVLIDLKTGKMTHQDLGQMQMYVNY